MTNLVGSKVERKEDKRFLTGKGQYTADINLVHQTYAYFVRSPHARAKIKNVDILGIRSKTNITKEIIDNAHNLKAIGCFCIGTDQVDLEYAAKKGIVVFNSPYMNTRSVAELAISHIINLSIFYRLTIMELPFSKLLHCFYLFQL